MRFGKDIYESRLETFTTVRFLVVVQNYLKNELVLVKVLCAIFKKGLVNL